MWFQFVGIGLVVERRGRRKDDESSRRTTEKRAGGGGGWRKCIAADSFVLSEPASVLPKVRCGYRCGVLGLNHSWFGAPRFLFS